MSTRTIIEINHDQLHTLKWDEEFWANLLSRLGGSHYNADLNEANEAGHSIDIGHGVRIVLQRHHATNVTVKTEYAEVRL
jgi:hypothetical protein